MRDLIDRQVAIESIETMRPVNPKQSDYIHGIDVGLAFAMVAIKEQPSVQPEPLSDAYAKAVLTWLIDYQIKAAKLKGTYTPYEVLPWVVNDWRKENELNNKTD